MSVETNFKTTCPHEWQYQESTFGGKVVCIKCNTLLNVYSVVSNDELLTRRPKSAYDYLFN